VDKPQLGEGEIDRLVVGERAVEKAFADAALAMFGFGGLRRAEPRPLAEVRRALTGARWRA
jgi:hypothetical protein